MAAAQTFVYFWKPHQKNGYLGNWYDSPFVLEEIQFKNSEQYLMWGKAKLFQDNKIAEEILKTSDPIRMKKLGQQVRGFEQIKWDDNKFHIMCTALTAKFSQNPELLKCILATNNMILVEASPFDKIWGIGMDFKEAVQTEQAKWRGENLLGKALMKVRDELKK